MNINVNRNVGNIYYITRYLEPVIWQMRRRKDFYWGLRKSGGSDDRLPGATDGKSPSSTLSLDKTMFVLTGSSVTNLSFNPENESKDICGSLVLQRLHAIMLTTRVIGETMNKIVDASISIVPM